MTATLVGTTCCCCCSGQRPHMGILSTAPKRPHFPARAPVGPFFYQFTACTGAPGLVSDGSESSWPLPPSATQRTTKMGDSIHHHDYTHNNTFGRVSLTHSLTHMMAHGRTHVRVGWCGAPHNIPNHGHTWRALLMHSHTVNRSSCSPANSSSASPFAACSPLACG